jgi:cell wall-associated NlpC family hydrolase
MDFSTFVGLPWRDHGRDATGYDCWGLFAAAFAAGTGIALPGYGDLYSAADRAETERVYAAEQGDWLPIQIGREQPFDGAAFRIAGRLHVGLVVRRGLMLHIAREKTSVIEPLARFLPSLIDIRRHRRLL